MNKPLMILITHYPNGDTISQSISGMTAAELLKTIGYLSYELNTRKIQGDTLEVKVIKDELPKFLEYHELKSLGVPYSKSHLYHLMKEDKFPSPINLSDNTVRWLQTDIEKWIKEKVKTK